MTPERGRASITAQTFSARTVSQTATTKAGNSKDDDDGKAHPFENGDWRADRTRDSGVLAGAPGHDLSLTQGTKTAGIPVGAEWRFNREVIERWMIQEEIPS
jgi:hypothetical protein